jgi:hypothetical protein
MQHYSRQVERSQFQIDQLSARALSYEASMTALEAFWEQVIAFSLLLLHIEFYRDYYDVYG